MQALRRAWALLFQKASGMKYSKLRSAAHNIADSLAVGIGLMIGVYDMDIFSEAVQSPEGFITVDFLTGTAEGARPSASLARAVVLYRDALPALCEREGITVSCFRVLTARFSSLSGYPNPHFQRQVAITVEDHSGRRSTDEYFGSPLRRTKTVDHLGRVRTTRRRI